jgi:hypothetical protein
MFGNLLNNKQIIDLRAAGAISISPFNANALKAVHYPLHVQSVYCRQPDGDWRRSHSFIEDKRPYMLAPREYVVVEIQEIIFIKEGIIGQCLPASKLVEGGLGLTAGRLEYPFGLRNETLRFGVCNLLNEPNQIDVLQHIAYIQFFDLRGLASRFVVVTQAELDFFASRIDEGQKFYGERDGLFPQEDSQYVMEVPEK